MFPAKNVVQSKFRESFQFTAASTLRKLEEKLVEPGLNRSLRSFIFSTKVFPLYLYTFLPVKKKVIKDFSNKCNEDKYYKNI